MPRVPLVDPETLPSSYDILEEDADRVPPDVDADWWNHTATVRSFANNPELAALHVHTNTAMWTRSGLSPREVEYVILSVGRAMESEIEWHTHVEPAAERAEITRSELLAISRRNTTEFDDSKRALIEYSFEFVEEYGAVSDERHDTLAEHYDDGQIVGVAFLAAYYVFIHHVATALGLELDEEFYGWELENF
jgi:alkylhydroperoxidase family enzyme